LQSFVRTQSGVDFNQPMSASQYCDQCIFELFKWVVFDLFLTDVNSFPDGFEKANLLNSGADGGERGTG
jgi:hypothetical protein